MLCWASKHAALLCVFNIASAEREMSLGLLGFYECDCVRVFIGEKVAGINKFFKKLRHQLYVVIGVGRGYLYVCECSYYPVIYHR